MKKKITTVLITIFHASIIFAQDWQTDFATAKEIAATEDKTIVMVFQGSDWCAPCIKLDKEIWSTEIFKSYAQDNLVMLKVDFPRRKKNALPNEQVKANASLAEKYNKSGVFPFVVVVDTDGKVLGETSYKKVSPESYIEELIAFTNE